MSPKIGPSNPTTAGVSQYSVTAPASGAQNGVAHILRLATDAFSRADCDVHLAKTHGNVFNHLRGDYLSHGPNGFGLTSVGEAKLLHDSPVEDKMDYLEIREGKSRREKPFTFEFGLPAVARLRVLEVVKRDWTKHMCVPSAVVEGWCSKIAEDLDALIDFDTIPDRGPLAVLRNDDPRITLLPYQKFVIVQRCRETRRLTGRDLLQFTGWRIDMIEAKRRVTPQDVAWWCYYSLEPHEPISTRMLFAVRSAYRRGWTPESIAPIIPLLLSEYTPQRESAFRLISNSYRGAKARVSYIVDVPFVDSFVSPVSVPLLTSTQVYLGDMRRVKCRRSYASLKQATYTVAGQEIVVNGVKHGISLTLLNMARTACGFGLPYSDVVRSMCTRLRALREADYPDESEWPLWNLDILCRACVGVFWTPKAIDLRGAFAGWFKEVPAAEGWYARTSPSARPPPADPALLSGLDVHIEDQLKHHWRARCLTRDIPQYGGVPIYPPQYVEISPESVSCGAMKRTIRERPPSRPMTQSEDDRFVAWVTPHLTEMPDIDVREECANTAAKKFGRGTPLFDKYMEGVDMCLDGAPPLPEWGKTYQSFYKAEGYCKPPILRFIICPDVRLRGYSKAALVLAEHVWASNNPHVVKFLTQARVLEKLTHETPIYQSDMSGFEALVNEHDLRLQERLLSGLDPLRVQQIHDYYSVICRKHTIRSSEFTIRGAPPMTISGSESTSVGNAITNLACFWTALDRLGIRLDWDDFFIVEGDDLIFDADILERNGVLQEEYEIAASELGMDVKLEWHSSMSDASFLGYHLECVNGQWTNTPADPYATLSKIFWDSEPDLSTNKHDTALLIARILSALYRYPYGPMSDYLVNWLKVLDRPSSGSARIAADRIWSQWRSEQQAEIKASDILNTRYILRKIGYEPCNEAPACDLPDWVSEPLEVEHTPRADKYRSWYSRQVRAIEHFAWEESEELDTSSKESVQAGKPLSPPKSQSTHTTSPPPPPPSGHAASAPASRAPSPRSDSSHDADSAEEVESPMDVQGGFVQWFCGTLQVDHAQENWSTRTDGLTRFVYDPQACTDHDMGGYHPNVVYSSEPLGHKVVLSSQDGVERYVTIIANTHRSYVDDHVRMEQVNPVYERQRLAELKNAVVFYGFDIPCNQDEFFKGSTVVDAGGNGACLVWAFVQALTSACVESLPIPDLVHPLTVYMWQHHRCACQVWDLPPIVRQVDVFDVSKKTIERAVFPDAPLGLHLKLVGMCGHFLAVIHTPSGGIRTVRGAKGDKDKSEDSDEEYDVVAEEDTSRTEVEVGALGFDQDEQVELAEELEYEEECRQNKLLAQKTYLDHDEWGPATAYPPRPGSNRWQVLPSHDESSPLPHPLALDEVCRKPRRKRRMSQVLANTRLNLTLALTTPPGQSPMIVPDDRKPPVGAAIRRSPTVRVRGEGPHQGPVRPMLTWSAPWRPFRGFYRRASQFASSLWNGPALLGSVMLVVAACLLTVCVVGSMLTLFAGVPPFSYVTPLVTAALCVARNCLIFTLIAGLLVWLFDYWIDVPPLIRLLHMVALAAIGLGLLRRLFISPISGVLNLIWKVIRALLGKL